MRLEDALEQLDSIAAAADRTATFRGFGTAAIACTSCIGLGAAVFQPWWMRNSASPEWGFVSLWFTAAVLSLAVVSLDMVFRYMRDPTARARRLSLTVLRCLLPSIIVGGGVAAIFAISRPDAVWVLPGVWALLLGLGIHAASPNLPASFQYVSLWYLACGLATFAFNTSATIPSGWSMAVPFGCGQLLTCWLVHQSTMPSFASEEV